VGCYLGQNAVCTMFKKHALKDLMEISYQLR
jgi:hypothetical protein